MKTLIIIACVALCASCHHFGHRHTHIRISNDNDVAEIRYDGHVEFDEDNTSITSMSPDSYLKYSKNGRTIIVESNEDGDIIYKVDGRRQLHLDREDKIFLSGGIREIAKATGRR